MNIYKITTTEGWGYDSYDSAIVVAKSKAEAASMHPYTGKKIDWKKAATKDGYSSDWATKKENVDVGYIGKASKDFKTAAVLCASFNAG
jgi:hypothetical protein